MNGTGTVIPLPLPYLYRTFVDVFLTHTVCPKKTSNLGHLHTPSEQVPTTLQRPKGSSTGMAFVWRFHCIHDMCLYLCKCLVLEDDSICSLPIAIGIVHPHLSAAVFSGRFAHHLHVHTFVGCCLTTRLYHI